MAEGPITELLNALSAGDRSALDSLVPLVYDELRRMASSYLRREPAGLTIQPTALVHEAYLKLAGNHPDCNSRAHFFGVASRLMRQILVDRARARGSAKRNGGSRVPLDDRTVLTENRAGVLISLDEALLDLERQDPEKARLLEQRYFGGMTPAESAQAMGIPVGRVNQQIRLAHAWLRRELADEINLLDRPTEAPRNPHE